MEDRSTSLYRFFAADDRLLYIGITNSVPRRLDQHGDTKPWYTEAVRVTLEHHSSRREALAAEKAAIQAEQPVWNIRHNMERKARSRSEGSPSPWSYRGEDLPQYEYYGRRGNFKRIDGIFLYPELDCSSMVDNYYGELDGEGQLEAYVEYIQEKYPKWWENDAIPIGWGVEPAGEFAPFATNLGWQIADPDDRYNREDGANFLTYYTWPERVGTHERLDWFSLPVKPGLRFPEFAEALAWVPTPMQPFCPLRSIMESRSGYPSKYYQWRRADSRYAPSVVKQPTSEKSSSAPRSFSDLLKIFEEEEEKL